MNAVLTSVVAWNVNWSVYHCKIEGLLLLLCGYLSFIVWNLQVIIQLYRSSTMNLGMYFT